MTTAAAFTKSDITIGCKKTTRLECTRAAALAAKLSKGYETQLGRMFGGQELSGGEWQRVALARAFIRRQQTELLVLDEPTSALDARIEHEIFTRMTELGRGKTVILVSHRFSSVRHADKIVLLERGRVVEEGDHESLLRLNGRYTELYRMQAERYQ